MTIKRTIPALDEIRQEMNAFQKELLHEIWEQFYETGVWPDLRTLYSKHEKTRVREALSFPLNGSVGREENGPQGRAIFQLSLIGVLLTKNGPFLHDLLERFFQFQRKLFNDNPKATSTPSTEIETAIGLSSKETLLLGTLLSLNFYSGPPNRENGLWSAPAMDEASDFPKTGNLSAQVDTWVCRFYQPNSWVFQDQREITPARAEVATAFVAMWFDPIMEHVWNEAFSLGISDAGYKPLRIDKHQHNNRIDDEIIAKIRECSFLVADFTGGRGGVYFEAGFALGLNKPVVWVVEKSSLEEVHFDTRQYAFVIWERNELAKLRRDLQLRIEATIGAGPMPR